MLAGEVDAAFGPGEGFDVADLSRLVQRKRSPLPRVEPPAVSRSALEFGGQLGKDLPRLLEGRGDAFLLAHSLQRAGVIADRIGRQRAALPGLGPWVRSEP